MAQMFVGKDTELNIDAVVTMPAAEGIFNCITLIVASYTASVTGRLTIRDGQIIIFDVDVLVANPPPYEFDGINRLKSAMGNAMEVRLYSGGLSVTGKLNVVGYTTDTYQ